MALKRIEDWVGNLPEVGDPMMLQVMLIKKIEREIEQLNEAVRLERKALRKEVSSLWTADEIIAASRGVA